MYEKQEKFKEKRASTQMTSLNQFKSGDIGS